MRDPIGFAQERCGQPVPQLNANPQGLAAQHIVGALGYGSRPLLDALRAAPGSRGVKDSRPPSGVEGSPPGPTRPGVQHGVHGQPRRHSILLWLSGQS